MPILESPKAFQVAVPDGWAVSGVPGREYVLSPGDEDVLAVTITVFPPRPKHDSDPKTSTGAVRAFAKKVGMEDPDSLAVLTPPAEKGQARAFATIHGRERSWFVGFLFFKEAFVLATAKVQLGNDKGLAVGEELVTSIASA